jgi:hypothetical protein
MGTWVHQKPKSGTGMGTSAFVANPPFDSRTGARGAVDSEGNFIQSSRAKLKRGYMITAKPGNTGKRYLLNFQYNPTSFAHSASLMATIPSLGTTGEEGENWMTFAESGQSVDFALLFDRTYETWGYDANKFASAQGVLADVKTLYAMLGLYYSEDAAGKSAGAGGGGAVEDPSLITTLAPTGVLTSVPVWVNFGPLMQYYGIVGSLNVTFTHFTQAMTPVRAAVNISLNVLPRTENAWLPSAEAAATAGTFTAAQNNTFAAQRAAQNQQRLQRSGNKSAWLT